MHGASATYRTGGSTVGLTASLQFVAALPPATASLFPLEPIFEFDRTPNLFRDKLRVAPIQPLDGWIDMPNRSGIGTEVDEEVLIRYRIHTENLLESAEDRPSSL